MLLVEQSPRYEKFMEFHVPQGCQVTPSDANFCPGGDGTVLVPGSRGVIEAGFLGLARFHTDLASVRMRMEM